MVRSRPYVIAMAHHFPRVGPSHTEKKEATKIKRKKKIRETTFWAKF